MRPAFRSIRVLPPRRRFSSARLENLHPRRLGPSRTGHARCIAFSCRPPPGAAQSLFRCRALNATGIWGVDPRHGSSPTSTHVPTFERIMNPSAWVAAGLTGALPLDHLKFSACWICDKPRSTPAGAAPSPSPWWRMWRRPSRHRCRGTPGRAGHNTYSEARMRFGSMALAMGPHRL